MKIWNINFMPEFWYASCSNRIKALCFCNPHNQWGAFGARKKLTKLGDIAIKHECRCYFR